MDLQSLHRDNAVEELLCGVQTQSCRGDQTQETRGLGERGWVRGRLRAEESRAAGLFGRGTAVGREAGGTPALPTGSKQRRGLLGWGPAARTPREMGPQTPTSQFYRPPKGWPPEPPREESSGDFRAILVPRAPDQLTEAS